MRRGQGLWRFLFGLKGDLSDDAEEYNTAGRDGKGRNEIPSSDLVLMKPIGLGIIPDINSL